MLDPKKVRARLAELERRRAEAERALSDPELAGLAREELGRIEEELLALAPTDPKDGRDAILEIRAAAGGREAELFALDLFRAYARFAERKRFRVRIEDEMRTSLGGVKYLTAHIAGAGAYGIFKYEAGVHRVQRIPVTEKAGRLHTSTVTVAVLPEVLEREFAIKPDDLRIETFRASGPGGQYVQKTESAVRITHLPTKIAVSVQSERSQHQNKERALAILRSKLAEFASREREEKLGTLRRSLIGRGMRAEKIRTYNFPQNRVTDHRIERSWYNIGKVLEGEFFGIVEALRRADVSEKLAALAKRK